MCIRDRGYDNAHIEGTKIIFSESENIARKLPPSNDDFFNNNCKFKPLKIIQHKFFAPPPYYYPCLLYTSRCV